MSDIARYLDGHLARAESRGLRRELSRMEARAQTALARIEMETDLGVARVHGVAFVGGQAQHATALLSEREGQLARIVPHAADRLQGITDLTVLGLAQILEVTVRRVSKQ